MNKNFVEKFSTVENILFLIFLFAFPTAFYLYNYSACAALGLEREAFYFCLELVVLFGLLFIIFSCFPHHFVRPMLTKNIFFVFSIIFIPWICYYANITCFYSQYGELLIYADILVGMFCFIIPGIPEPKANAKEIFSISDTFLYHYAIICPTIIACYLSPLIHTAETLDDPKFLFVFAFGISMFCYIFFIAFTYFRFLLPCYNFLKKLIIFFLYPFIPYFIYHGVSTNHMLKYGFLFIFIWIAGSGLIKFILLDLPRNEDGIPLPRPQPPDED